VNYLDFSNYQIDIILLGIILFCTYAFFWTVQILFYSNFYFRIFFKPKPAENLKPVPVSVVICAKDEAENLRKFLPLVLTQKYHDYEVIVVNDCSSDETETVLALFKEQYSHLYVTTIHEDEKFSHGKKLALTVGIKAAKNDLLLLTDADCMPESENWISSMQQNFTDDTQINLGFGGYIKEKGMLNRLIRFDTMWIALQYMGFAKAGIPYMGVGRNLAYRKSFFFKNKGFASQIHLMSGDDDMFVNQFATAKNTKVELSAESFTRSTARETLEQWITQKKRHFTTSKYYKFKHKLLLGGEVFSRMIFYLLFAILLVMDFFSIPVLVLFLLRLILQNIAYYKACKMFKEKDLIFLCSFFDIILPLVNFNAYFSNLIARKRMQWK